MQKKCQRCNKLFTPVLGADRECPGCREEIEKMVARRAKNTIELVDVVASNVVPTVTREVDKVTQEKEDIVNHPEHYTYGGIETIDYMKAKSTPEEYRGYLRLSSLKYLSRAGHKDDTLQDYKKARWYLNRFIGEVEGD